MHANGPFTLMEKHKFELIHQLFMQSQESMQSYVTTSAFQKKLARACFDSCFLV